MTITLKPRATYQNGIWTCWTDTDSGRRVGTSKTLEQGPGRSPRKGGSMSEQHEATDDMGDYFEELDAAQFHATWAVGLVQARVG